MPSGSGGESEAKALKAAGLIKKADDVDGWPAAAATMIEMSPESWRPTRGSYELQSAVWDHLWNRVGNKVVKKRF